MKEHVWFQLKLTKRQHQTHIKILQLWEITKFGEEKRPFPPFCCTVSQSFPIICLTWQPVSLVAPCRQSLPTAAAQLLELSNHAQSQGVEGNMG